jgi:hypothetical protein
MRPYFSKVLVGFLCLVTSQAIVAQTDTKKTEELPVNSADILRKLTGTAETSKLTDQINKELIGQVKKRSVDFALNDDLIKQIKEAGGSELLLSAIDNALPKERKERLKEMDRLEKIVRKNYARNSTLHLAIKAGQELIDKFSIDYECSEFLQWLKAQMPRWHERISRY